MIFERVPIGQDTTPTAAGTNAALMLEAGGQLEVITGSLGAEEAIRFIRALPEHFENIRSESSGETVRVYATRRQSISIHNKSKGTMYTVSDNSADERVDWAESEDLLGRILQNSSSVGAPLNSAVLRYALRALSRVRQSVRTQYTASHPLDMEIYIRTSERPPGPWNFKDRSYPILVAQWASGLANADEFAVWRGASLAVQYPWIAWILPATLQWIRDISGADYTSVLSEDVHALVLQHIQFVDQDCVCLDDLDSVVSEYSGRVCRGTSSALPDPP